jgi:hypothetical protein
MAASEDTARTYHQLAQGYERIGDASMRDRFLVLAADAYLAASRPSDAEQVRAHLVRVNPQHLLKGQLSMVQALQSSDVRNYVDGLKRHYPPDQAAKLLRELQNRPATAPNTATRPQAPGGPIPMTLAGPPPGRQDVYQVLPVAANPTRREIATGQSQAPLPGSWFCIVLFWLGLLAAIAWLAYTLGLPFWPH